MTKSTNMRTILPLTLFLLLFLTCCKSKEEKAQDLIKTEMFKTLYDFESYEPIETKIDSAFRTIYLDSTALAYGYLLFKELDEINNYLDEAKSAQSTMEIWEDSYSSYGLRKYYEAKNKVDICLAKAKECFALMEIYGDSIRKINLNIKPEFFGWKVSHKFRCKTKGGNFDIGNHIFYANPDMSKIIYQENVDDESLIKIKNLISEAIEKTDTITN